MRKFNYKFYTGSLILIFLGASYFIKIHINEFDTIIRTSLLGILIFYNPFVLGIYILISLILIVKGRNVSRHSPPKS